jgi:hypothetical protein
LAWLVLAGVLDTDRTSSTKILYASPLAAGQEINCPHKGLLVMQEKNNTNGKPCAWALVISPS